MAPMQCDPNSSFFGFMGITGAMVFSNLGAAYGTAKSGVGISSMGVMRPDLVMRSIIPVIMAGILGIYGLIISIVINGSMDTPELYSTYAGYSHLAAGLTVGLSALAAGLAIGIVGDSGVRANAQQPKLFVGMMLILIFAEALGLYDVYEERDREGRIRGREGRDRSREERVRDSEKQVVPSFICKRMYMDVDTLGM